MTIPSDYENHFWKIYRERIRRTHTPVLMLDYDGTLAPFVADRNVAYPYRELVEPVHEIIAQTKTRLIINSGRTIESLVPLIHDWMPIECWGSHGWESLSASGIYTLWSMLEPHFQVLKAVESQLLQTVPSGFLEVKPSSIAVHWRSASAEVRKQLTREVERVKAFAQNTEEIEYLEFSEGYEFRLTGRNKGTVLQDIMKNVSEDAFIVYAGDDKTDEDAFLTLNRLNGVGILIAAQTRPSSAQFWMTTPDQLRSFLCEWKRILTEN